MSINNLLESELNNPSVFVDESKLSAQYVPQNLLFRTSELKFLASYFKGMFEKIQDGKHLTIYGKVGTGKTSLVKKFGQWINERKSKQNLKYIHVNCRRNKSPYVILLSIARHLNSHVPTRGYSSQELMDMIIDLLEVKRLSLFLVLDEIDFVNHDELSNLVYSFTRTNDNLQNPSHQLSIVLISRSLSFLDLLDDSTKSTLSGATLKLEPYTEDQIRDILEDRINESFKTGTVTEEAIKLAAEIGGKNGDARQALELLWFGGKHADLEQKGIIYPESIRIARSKIKPTKILEYVKLLDKHPLLVCLGICRELQYSKEAHVTTGIAKKAYYIACEEYSLQPRKTTQFWEYLKELSRQEIIVTEKSSKGQRGQTQLISIEDISVKILERKIEKIIDIKVEE